MVGRTKGNHDYHVQKLSRAQENFEVAGQAHRAEKAKQVEPSQKAQQNDIIFNKGKVVDMYRAKIKKNQTSINQLKQNEKLPGSKTPAHIEQKDKAKAERARARQNTPIQSKPRSSNANEAGKPMTKGDYQYHHKKYNTANYNRRIASEAYADAAAKKVPAGPQAEAHKKDLSQRQDLIKAYDGKVNKNLHSMYSLENNLKVPGPKNVEHIEQKHYAQKAKGTAGQPNRNNRSG